MEPCASAHGDAVEAERCELSLFAPFVDFRCPYLCSHVLLQDLHRSYRFVKGSRACALYSLFHALLSNSRVPPLTSNPSCLPLAGLLHGTVPGLARPQTAHSCR